MAGGWNPFVTAEADFGFGLGGADIGASIDAPVRGESNVEDGFIPDESDGTELMVGAILLLALIVLSALHKGGFRALVPAR